MSANRSVDLTLLEAVEQMLTEGRRQIAPLNLGHSSPVGAERQAGEFFLDPLALDRIRALAQRA